MASLMIDEIGERMEKRLRSRAERHGHSIEDEARMILDSVLGSEIEQPPSQSLAEAIVARMKPFGGITLELPPREAIREPVDFDR